ncbi:unnamed protein product [Hymenolepis diminuta]|uniref:Secreted protein n=1 Tax=Hymenolepis diminuta TaxID=6216 RepID=A0A564YU88_HYMDI|nr:unnamed protein product [Hymenolepis diminuta]
MSKCVHRFPLFSLTALLHTKGTSALVLSCGLTQNNARWSDTDSYTSCSSPLFLCTLLSLYVSLCYSFQTLCGFLEYIFGLYNSWCSASQLLLALTQTATNWLTVS